MQTVILSALLIVCLISAPLCLVFAIREWRREEFDESLQVVVSSFALGCLQAVGIAVICVRLFG